MNTVNENKSFLFFPTDTCLFTPGWCSSFPFSLWEAGKHCLLAIPAISMPIWREQAAHCHFCSSKLVLPRTNFFLGVLKSGNSWDLGGNLWALTKIHRGPVIEELDINVNSSMLVLCFSEKTPWDSMSWTDPNFQVNNHSQSFSPCFFGCPFSLKPFMVSCLFLLLSVTVRTACRTHPG